MLTGIPFSLAVEEEAAGGELFLQAFDEFAGEAAFVGTDGGGVPFVAVHVVDGDEGGFATHGEADVGVFEVLVDEVAEGDDVVPLLKGVGFGDARGFLDPGDFHLEVELDFGFAGEADDGGGGLGVWSGGDGEVAFAGHEAGGGVEADPAGAGEVDFGPGVEVGEVVFGAGGAVEALDVGLELDEVTGDEAGGEAEVAEGLAEEPGGVAAGAGAEVEGFFGGLDAGFEADGVADVLPDVLVQGDEEVDGAGAGVFVRGGAEDVGFGEDAAGGDVGGFGVNAGDGVEEVGVFAEELLAEAAHVLAEERGEWEFAVVGFEFVGENGVVAEGEVLGLRFEEEVEGVEDGHFGDEIDFDGEFAGGFVEDEAGEVIGLGVLLPVDKVVLGGDAEGVAEDGGAAVRGGAQADDVRGEGDGPVVAIARDVAEGDVDGHAWGG